jgi:hypothetical protein
MTRRFPPPWPVKRPDPKLERQCYIIRDANGHAHTYVYFEDEPSRRSAAKMLTRKEGAEHCSEHREAAGAVVPGAIRRRGGLTWPVLSPIALLAMCLLRRRGFKHCFI